MERPDVITHLFSRRAEAQHALRVTAAALAAYLLAKAFSLPQGYWAVFTAVIVVQTSIGGTLSASIDRMIGTIAGAAVGAVLLWLHQRWGLDLTLAVGIAVASTAFLATLRPDLKVAPVTAVIMLISPTVSPEGPAIAAVLRVAEIALGSAIGVAAATLIFPARAHALAGAKAEAVLGLLAQLCEQLVENLTHGAEDRAFYALHASVRTGLTQLEAALTDVARERSTRLGGRSPPEGLARVLWRLRNDVSLISRVGRHPLPEPVWVRLEPAADDMLRTAAASMRALGAALKSGGAGTFDRRPLETTHRRLQDTVQALRRDGLTRVLDFDEAGQVFSLSYGLEGLYLNLIDLADRIAPGAAPSEAAHAEL